MVASVNAVPPAKLILRWGFRFLIGIFLMLLGLLACIYVFLQRDPDALISKYLSEIEARAGVKFTIGSIDVTLLPLPAIAISDLGVKGPHLDFTAAWASATPGFIKILHGDFMPASVTISRPSLNLISDLPLGRPFETLNMLASRFGNGRKAPPMLALPDMDIDLNQLSVTIKGSDNSILSLSGLQAQGSLSESGAWSGLLHLSAMRIMEGDTQIGSLEDLRITGKISISDFFGATDGVAVTGLLRWAGIFKSCDFSGEFGSSTSGWASKFAIAADIDLEDARVPLKLSGKLGDVANGAEIAIRDLDWELGPDSGTMHLTCRLPREDSPFSLAGTLLANRLSLTEWFGFARNLTPGLQQSLDNITGCSMDFTLTEKGVEATNIKASCAGSTFTGTGGVADWTRPVVKLTLRAPEANLIAGLPEAAAATPDSPWYPHKPLTPLPTEPLLPGETGIGYDIRLSADKLLYGPVKFEKAALQIHPGKLDKTGFQDVLLDAKASFYGGSVIGHCILGADPSLPYYITATARNINGAPLAKDMPVLPFRQGKYEAKATVTSKGKQLDLFLANLKGTINSSGQNATLSATGAKLPFSSLGAGLKLRSAAWNGKKLTFAGQWSATAKTGDFSADCSLNGKMLFGDDGLNFSGLPGSIQAVFTTGPLPAGAKFKLQGKFGAAPDQSRFEVTGATLDAFGQKFTGAVRIDASRGNPAFQGSVKTEIANLDSALRQFGLEPAAIPKEFSRLKFESAFSGNPDLLKFSKIRAILGKTEISGSLDWKKLRQRNYFETDLNINSFTLAETSTSNKTPDWNFHGLTTFDASGKIRIFQANIWDTHLANLHIDYRLTEGKLNITPLTANFYGAPLTCSLSADFQKGLDFNAKLHVQAFNLHEAAKDRKLKTLLKGSASLDAQFGANLAGKAKLLNALKGSWSFNIKNGSWQSLDKNGHLQGKPTNFNLISASGKIGNGHIISSDFLLTGDGLKVSGTSSLKFANQDLDCKFNVDMKGWPDFPLYIYGPLSNIKTSIGAGKLALNAIGEVVGGFTNAIGGLFKGAINIFK